MRQLTIRYFCLMAMSLCALGEPSNAQTIGYSGAVGQLAAACGADIGKYCGKATLGGGRMGQCLEQNRAAISPGCKASLSQMACGIQSRSPVVP